jgi:hypothetical protein
VLSRERPRGREKPRAVSARELRALPSAFFSGLETADLEALGAAMFQRSYPAGQIVLLEGAASSVLYVVQAGRLKLFKTSPRGREQVLRLLPGDMFNGWPSSTGPEFASAQAIEAPCTCCGGATCCASSRHDQALRSPSRAFLLDGCARRSRWSRTWRFAT